MLDFLLFALIKYVIYSYHWDCCDKHHCASGGWLACVVGDESGSDSTDDAAHVEQCGEVGGMLGGHVNPGLLDEGGQPVEERVADQLGEEEAEGELDDAGDLERAHEADRLGLLLALHDDDGGAGGDVVAVVGGHDGHLVQAVVGGGAAHAAL